MNGITDFYYDGWRVIEERKPDLQAGTDVTVRQMTYGIYLDEVWTVDARRDAAGGAVSVSMLNDGTLGGGGAGGESHRVFCHANTLYHVRGVSDEAGALREAFQYTPYGVHTRIADGPDADSVVNFGADDVRTAGARSAFGVSASFTGQRFDPETGLHYYKNRYYSARLGRFVSRDPLGIWSGCGDVGNDLAYVDDNPVNRADSLGESWFLMSAGAPPVAPPRRPPPPPPARPPVPRLRPPAVPPPVCPPVPCGGGAAAAGGGSAGVGVGGALVGGAIIAGELVCLMVIVDGTLEYRCQAEEAQCRIEENLYQNKKKKDFGNCTPKQHSDLSRAVGKACKSVARSCQPGGVAMGDCDELKHRWRLNVNCYNARKNMDDICFGGGNSDHADKRQEELKAARSCADRYRSECLGRP